MDEEWLLLFKSVGTIKVKLALFNSNGKERRLLTRKSLIRPLNAEALKTRLRCELMKRQMNA